jgi:hypothetical protein
MTAPQEPPEPQGPPRQIAPPEPPAEEGGSLIPALLLIYATYLLYRGAHGSISRSWQKVVTDLGLVDLAAGQLMLLAARTMNRLRQAYGPAGDELFMVSGQAARVGVNAGLQMIAEALIWTDHQDNGDPTTKDMAADSADQTSGFVPTQNDPPDLLAQMVANAVRDATVLAAADLAGWRQKVWNSVHDDRVRDTHQVLDGQGRALGESFDSPSGAKLRYPHDPLAPISEVANCRCFLTVRRR